MKSLIALGWSKYFEAAWLELDLEHCVPARVVADYGASFKLALPEEITAESSGKLQYMNRDYEKPKVGDWVAVQKLDDAHGIIHEVLRRRTEISRKQPGDRNEKQVLAANVDLAFLIQALDHDFSPQRLRRYLFQLAQYGVRPVVVLNKSDIADDIDAKVKELQSFDVEIIVMSAKEQQGVDQIAGMIDAGDTAVLLGSSGVGKSTITNALLGDSRQATSEIRQADSKGRHTTTHRELFILPGGGLIIDTPGLRELQLWGDESDLGSAFPDIEALAIQCRFNDCSHAAEPGCAVAQAKDSGKLDATRLEYYFKFQKELRHLASQINVAAAQQRKVQNKKMQKRFNDMIRSKEE